jgi:2-phosphosulfolactate phosphatase
VLVADRGDGDVPADLTDVAGSARPHDDLWHDLPRVTAGHRQQGWDLRFEWGTDGLRAVAPDAVAVVVVDVLRFTSAVSVAVGRGGVVLPYVWTAGDAARAYAARHDAELAGWREDGGWSLSPTDLAGVPAGTRLVLPSPNGSALAFGAQDDAPGAQVLAGCLRNAAAVAAVAGRHSGPVAVVAAGERWHGDLGTLRPSVEDLLGAGAVLRALVDVADRPPVSASPEARAAMAAFDAARDDLGAWLADSASGRELVAIGFGDDVDAAARLDAEDVAPVLDGPAFAGVTPAAAGHLR